MPHPEICARLFVLRPLCDIAPGVTLPDGTTAATLLARHADPDDGIRERLTGWDAGWDAGLG